MNLFSLMTNTKCSAAGAFAFAFAFLTMSGFAEEFDATAHGDAILWFDAGSGVTAEDNAVTSWISRVGDIEATVPEGATAPQLETTSDKPAVRFSNEQFLAGQCVGPAGPATTFVFVGVIDPLTNDAQSARMQSGVVMFRYNMGIMVDRKTGKLRTPINPENVESIAGKCPEEISEMKKSLGNITNEYRGVPVILTAVFAENATSFYINGTEAASAPIGSGFTMENTPFGLGATATTDAVGMEGTISEAIIYNEALDPERRGKLEDALSAKHGISLTK